VSDPVRFIDNGIFRPPMEIALAYEGDAAEDLGGT
jgi:hypothetical protein